MIFSLPTYAETLSLQSAINQAMVYSPVLKLQKNRMHQVELERRKALGGALPQISASYDFSNYLTKPSYGGFSLNSTYERTASLQVTQSLFSFGAVSNAIKAADAAIEMTKLQEDLVERDVIYAVQVAYFSVQLAQEQLSVSQESLKNAQSNLSVLRSYFSSGRPPQQDLIKLQADIASRSSQVQESRKNLEQAKTQLKVLIGMPVDEQLDLSDADISNSVALQQGELRKNLLQNQPQLKALDKQIEYSDRLARAQRSSIYPSLGAFYSVSSSERSDREFYDTDSNVNASVVGLSLSWSIWNGGSNRAELKKAFAIKKAAEIQKSQQQDQLVQALKDKVVEYQTLQANLKNDEDSVRLAKESYRVSQNRFRTGKTSVTELNSTELLLYSSMLTKALHQFQLNESYASIKKLVSEKEGQ